MSSKQKTPDFYEYYPKLFHNYFAEIDSEKNRSPM